MGLSNGRPGRQAELVKRCEMLKRNPDSHRTFEPEFIFVRGI